MLQGEQGGIGFEIVRKYLANGAKVVLFGSRKETVEKRLRISMQKTEHGKLKESVRN